MKTLPEMKEILKAANKAYREGCPIVTDEEYDSLREEYFKESGEMFSNLEKAGQVTLSEPMLSLQNCFTKEEFESFVNRTYSIDPTAILEVYVEPKVDGVALDLRYYKGKLVSASTRGDGELGEDVTSAVLTIKTFPIALENAPDFLWVRGEAVCFKAEFDQFNSTSTKKFKNPRNFASGTIRAKNEDVSDRPIRFVPYRQIVPNENGQDHYTSAFWSRFGISEYHFFEASFSIHISQLTYEKLVDTYKDYKENLPFEVDGVVVKYVCRKHQQILGNNSETVNWAIAFKQRVEGVKTTVVGITFQVGRTGVVTPVANLAPVEVGGVTITKATLHNRFRMEELQLGVNAEVMVRRAGEVIPEIYENVSLPNTSTEMFKMPEYCPSCGRKLTEDKCTLVFDAEDMEVFCFDKFVNLLIYFFGPSGMKVDGVGPEMCEFLFDSNIMSHPLQVLDILEPINQADLITRMGSVKAANLTLGVLDLSTQPFWKFVAALGIDNIGPATAKQLAPYLVKILSGERCINSVLTPVAAASFSEFIERKGYKELLAKCLSKLTPTAKETSSTLNGLTVMLTGTSRLSRSEIEDFLMTNGAKVGSSISKKTSYLIVGENSGSKLDKAKSLAVPTGTLDEFLIKYGLSI